MFGPVAMALSPDLDAATAAHLAPTSARKEKTILNWLVKSSSVTNDDRENNNRLRDNCNCESRAFRDFRGVQTLRLLWSKRINSASEDQQHTAAAARNSSLGTLKKLNKSVSCLVNAFNNARDWPTTPEKTLAKRAASLHNLQDSCVQQQRQLQREKDNFYKYKNAEQAKMRKEAIINAPKQSEAILNASQEENNNKDCKMESPKTLSVCDNGPGLPPALPTNVSLSLSATSAQCGSTESIQTNSTSTSTAQTVTSTVRTATRRKYSFKTHAGKSYHQHHTPRRMSSLSLNGGMSGGQEAPPSMVAKLTQQFNEIIQKDGRVLEQVKRKNGVWLARGSHVYKIVEKPAAVHQQPAEDPGSGTVQRNIKKFEKLEKPAVPLKTQQLMRKHQELMASQRPANPNLRTKRNLKLPAGQLPQLELAVVREETTKTPPVESTVVEAEVTKPKPEEVADEQDDEAELERQKQRKHKYASIYEKLRFTFAKGKKSSPNKSSSELNLVIKQEKEQEQEQQQQLEDEAQLVISPCLEAEAKILDALEVLDEKLKVLKPSADSAELLLAANDDFEQRILPNNSFVYQAANKQISNNQLLLTQAVNVTLVNAIEGEQMIMEQKQLAEDNAKLEEEQRQEATDPESIYEPISQPSPNEVKTEPQASSLFKLASQNSETQEDIYQTVEEACPKVIPSPNWLEGYESIAGSREAAAPYDGYEAFAPVEKPITPSPTTTFNGTLGRNTRDELPELPKPKRVLNKSPQPLRPAPPKPIHGASSQTKSSEAEEDENIYDTIKGCYESMQAKASKDDRISINSNCYESISNYRKSKTTTACIQLSSSGSTLTISSDHKTNSLYESSLAAGNLYGCRSSLSSGSNSSGTGKPGDKRSSFAGSSDNSDAWVDISDGEVAEAAAAETTITESQFIVVREQRFKPHRTRSPDWSKRIRDKRLQQKKAISCIEDDSDHYYETLSPLGNKRHSTQLLSAQHHKRHQDVPHNGIRASHRRSKQHSVSAHALGEHVANSDDYDSFETDSDEPGEPVRHHNDSGVDMRHHSLPKPPAQQNQVYEFVRKFKDFISNKKSPKSSQQKLYENTATQFYVESSKQPTPKNPDEIYETTELSASNKQLNLSPSEQPTLLRAKQKNGKSLRSRLRKSLVGSTFDTKQLSTLTATRSTFYIEDPDREPLGSGQLDSGFSEKASSGDIPVQQDQQKFSTVMRKSKKEAKATRRRTTCGIRPHDPPPPPPPVSTSGNKTPSEQSQTTSWYAECGVFKQSSGSGSMPQINDELTTPTTPSINGGGSSWYAESGLYQTSGNSVASSSGSSGVSTGNEAGLGDELQPHGLFSNEPLYQMYSAAKLESITRDLEGHESSTDGYEEIGQNVRKKIESLPQPKPRPSALQLVEPRNGPSRTLWSEIPEVIHSCILPTLTPRERGLQEAKFEIITSEASYLKSLNLLRRHFMNHSAFVDSSVLSPRDRKALFSYIVPVHECSERLLTELENCWQNNIMLLGLSRCIYEIAERHFHVYIAFCEHQGRMDRTLRRLKESKNGAFQQHLEKLEASPSCCGLNLHSFLMLPMQRITRLPLLIDAVFSKESTHNKEEYESWKLTLALVQKIVSECNEAANRWEQAYELERISKQLEFPSYIRSLAIAPCGVPKQGAKPRFLVKRGELTHLMWRGDDAKLTFGKRFTKSSIYAFLFSDLLVLTKRKGEGSFSVLDYCPRSMLTIASGDTLQQLPTKDLKDQTGKNLILMTLLENYERKTVELVLSCPSVSDQQRWLQAMRPPEAETPGEKLYESWDCPQVIAKHSYQSDEPDVLQLEQGDVVNVSRKLPDGWYQGERIRDGAVGWFPGTYTEELNSAHVRSRNLKQRHRLLTFTATYLEAQKSK